MDFFLFYVNYFLSSIIDKTFTRLDYYQYYGWCLISIWVHLQFVGEVCVAHLLIFLICSFLCCVVPFCFVCLVCPMLHNNVIKM